MNTPKYTITDKTFNTSMKIVELFNEAHDFVAYNRDLHLRKVNRLKSIQSSLAIENNSLTLEQVTDIIKGKHIFGPPKDIQEVKNAYEAYEHLLEYAPYQVSDFLKAHQMMTLYLVQDAGHFRSVQVGVFDSQRHMVHQGANYIYVPQLITDLFVWAQQSELHPLIKSSIVHFKIEFIHPFVDGNGRMGRLWQTCILSQWKKAFAWMPIESIVYEHQQEYYDALAFSQKEGDSGIFVEFMVETIYKTLQENIRYGSTTIYTDILSEKFIENVVDGLSAPEKKFLADIYPFLDTNGAITNSTAQKITNKSATSIKQYFSKLLLKDILLVTGEKKGIKYLLNRDKLRMCP